MACFSGNFQKERKYKNRPFEKISDLSSLILYLLGSDKDLYELHKKW